MEGLITVAIIGLAATMLMNFAQISSHFKMKLDDNEIANASYLKLKRILLDTRNCDFALRRADGAAPIINLAGDTVIDVVNYEAGTVAMTVGQSLGGNVQLGSLVFRLSPPGQVAGTLVLPTGTYRTYYGNLIMGFNYPQVSMGGATPNRTIPLILGVNTATNGIERCFAGLSADHFCTQLGGVIGANNACTFPNLQRNCSTAPLPPCGALACSNGHGSVPMYYLAGFDANSQPICLCSRVCQ